MLVPELAYMAIAVIAVHSLPVIIFLKKIFSSATCSIVSIRYDLKKLFRHLAGQILVLLFHLQLVIVV